MRRQSPDDGAYVGVGGVGGDGDGDGGGGVHKYGGIPIY